MTSESDLDRRVYRLETETVAIYDQISEHRAETKVGFIEAQTRFDRVESTLTEVLKRLPEQT